MKDVITTNVVTQDAPANARTQRARILRLLLDARGAWVPLPEIMACAAQYNARILDLRREGFEIENRTEVIDGIRHSWYRLAASPAPPKPESANAATPDFQDRPRVTGLPLWDAVRR